MPSSVVKPNTSCFSRSSSCLNVPFACAPARTSPSPRTTVADMRTGPFSVIAATPWTIRSARSKRPTRAAVLGSARPRIPVGEVGIGGEGEIVAAVFFLTAADDHGPEGVAQRQHLPGVCHHDRAIALPRRHESGSEPEADLGVSRLLCGLGFEGGDFRGRNTFGPWPACAGHDQTAQTQEQGPATSQRRGLPPNEGGGSYWCLTGTAMTRVTGTDIRRETRLIRKAMRRRRGGHHAVEGAKRGRCRRLTLRFAASDASCAPGPRSA